MSATIFIDDILGQLYRTEQVDLLFLALTNLLEMIEKNELDIILDQRGKEVSQKKAFIQKVISGVESPELKQALQGKLAGEEIEFFRERNLESTLSALQKEAEQIEVVELRVAVTFKEPDLREMVAQLEEQLGKHVALDITVEHSLIGGVVVQHGTFIRDSSIRARLEQFREHWKKAVVEA